MTPLVRRYVKTSFVFLLAGVLLGASLVVTQFLGLTSASRLVVVAHVHILLVGFVLILIMGVATWMFPRPGRDDVRYHPGLAETVYWLITISTAVRALAEIAMGLSGLPTLRWPIVAGGLGQAVGTMLFVLNMWSRVRMPRVPPAV